MAVALVPAEPPQPGRRLSEITTTRLSAPAIADLHAAMLADVCVAVEESGCDLLVNYRPENVSSGDQGVRKTAETTVRDLLAAALTDPANVRFEPQAGSNYSARIGNSVTHLLDEEGEDGVIVIEPTVPMLGRTGIDQIAMKLRRSEVVLAPAPGGRIAAAGFTATVDFSDVYQQPSLLKVTERSLAAGYDPDFVPLSHRVETPRDLASFVADLRAQSMASRRVPKRTLEVLNDNGITSDGQNLGIDE